MNARTYRLGVTVAGALPLLVACSSLDRGEPRSDAGASDDAGAGAGTNTAPPDDAGRGADAGAAILMQPGEDCEPSVLPCFPVDTPGLVEVPTEGTLEEVIALDPPPMIIQVRGLDVPTIALARSVLRGCDGARIVGDLAFKDVEATVEGFLVTGTIVAQSSGAYVVHRNRFVGENGTAAAVAAKLVAGALGTIELKVARNLFESRTTGIETESEGSSLIRIDVQNNLFLDVQTAIRLGENGGGAVTARIQHNTFVGFGLAVGAGQVDRRVSTASNILSRGTRGFAIRDFTAPDTIVHRVLIPSDLVPPSTGPFLDVDPLFVDDAAKDYRLRGASPAIDRATGTATYPPLDYRGCPRPAVPASANPRPDIGAIEARPL